MSFTVGLVLLADNKFWQIKTCDNFAIIFNSLLDFVVMSCQKQQHAMQTHNTVTKYVDLKTRKYRTLHYLNISCHAYYDVRTIPCVLGVTSL